MRTFRSTALLLPLVALGACGVDANPAASTAAGDPARAAAAAPVCVTFDPIALGATFGAPAGHVPGALAFVENGIPVTVHKFHHPGGLTSFNRFDIVPAIVGPPPFGTNHIARVNNINLGFDFSGLSFVPSSVTFEWRDYGGHENLRVNGSGVFIGELTAAPAPVVSAFFVGGGFKQGSTTVPGPVKFIAVGGQEFFLDNVCAHP